MGGSWGPRTQRPEKRRYGPERVQCSLVGLVCILCVHLKIIMVTSGDVQGGSVSLGSRSMWPVRTPSGRMGYLVQKWGLHLCRCLGRLGPIQQRKPWGCLGMGI